MSNIPDYEVEIEVKGSKMAVVGYAQVRAKSTREALAVAIGLVEWGGVAWFDREHRRVHWADFERPNMDIQIADITPYGTKWVLRRYADAVAPRPTDE